MDENSTIDELKRLKDIAGKSIYGKGTGKLSAQYGGQVFMKYMVPGSVLELGPAEGIMTEIIYPHYKNDYTAVDGSVFFIDSIKKRFPDIHAYSSLFEEFMPSQKFSNILLGHVLEHVIDPVRLLKRCKDWLEDDGVILTAVPNANSIHRQAALEMGLLKHLDDFSEKDHRHGHRRVFCMDTLKECFQSAECRVLESGGYWLKPLSDAQLEKDWTIGMLNAFFKLGEKYPEISGEIYIVAGKV